MAEVCKGNVYLTVDEDEVDKYMSKGYSLVDERTGKIIKQSMPTEIGPLKKMYSELLETNKLLTEEIAILRKKLDALQTVEAEETPASTSEEASDSWEDWGEDTTKKKKSTRSRK